MSRNLDKLRGLLAELFQLNQADLDFGIYRIMNQKRDEITAFLDNDLLPQVRTELSNVQDSGTAEAKAEHDKLVQQLGDAGVDPDTSPKVRELRERYRTGGDIDVLENEVLSHLYDFFRRYYSEGDFISQRRYKERLRDSIRGRGGKGILGQPRPVLREINGKLSRLCVQAPIGEARALQDR